MNFPLILHMAWRVVILRYAAIKELAFEEHDAKLNYALFLASSLAFSLGKIIFPVTKTEEVGGAILTYKPDLFSAFFGTIGFFILLTILSHLTAFFSRFLGSKLRPESLIPVMSHASLVLLLALVPQLAIPALIWLVIVLFFTLRKFGKMPFISLAIVLFLLLGFSYTLYNLLDLLGLGFTLLAPL